MTSLHFYDNQLEVFQEKIQPMHDSTLNYYNPHNDNVVNFEFQLRMVQDMIDNFFCCSGIEDYNEPIEDCNYCFDYNGEDNLDKRIKILEKEFKELEKLDRQTESIRYL